MWHLWRMSALSERIIAENYNSVVAAQDMKESLERQDSAGLFALLDRWDRAGAQLGEHRARFDAAYQRAAANITEPGEAEIIETIGRTRDEYYRRFDRFLLDARGDGSTGRRSSGPAADEYFSAARAAIHRSARAMRSSADPQSRRDAPEGCRGRYPRTPLVRDDSRYRPYARRGRNLVRDALVEQHCQTSPAADRRYQPCSSRRSRHGRGHPLRRRARWYSPHGSTKWPSGSGSIAYPTSGRSWWRSKPPRRPWIPCTIP